MIHTFNEMPDKDAFALAIQTLDGEHEVFGEIALT
jgi:hypothetical protein